MLNDWCSQLWSRVLTKWNQGEFLESILKLTSWCLCSCKRWHLTSSESMSYPPGLVWVRGHLMWWFHLNSTHQICFGNTVLYRDFAFSRKIRVSLNYCNLELKTDSCEPTFPNPPTSCQCLDARWWMNILYDSVKPFRSSSPSITQWMPERMLGGGLTTLLVFFKFLLWKIF